MTPDVGQQLSSVPNDSSPPVSPLPLLLPGEVVKFSGKYSTTTTSNTATTAALAQVKNSIKDEVVIRNADSGKGKMQGSISFDSLMTYRVFQNGCSAPPVMGIKGRRVHLIEEISDTVISFQRGILQHFACALGNLQQCR